MTSYGQFRWHLKVYLSGAFHGAIVVPSVTRCRCCRRRCHGHQCAGGMRQWRSVTVATPGEWQCKTGGVRRPAEANGPNIFQMLLVNNIVYLMYHYVTAFFFSLADRILSGGGSWKVWSASLYSGSLGAEPPAESRDSPRSGVRRAKPPEAESIFVFE